VLIHLVEGISAPCQERPRTSPEDLLGSALPKMASVTVASATPLVVGSVFPRFPLGIADMCWAHRWVWL